MKKLDIHMCQQKHFILLLLDNFSGHKILYEPKNIRIEFFAPNLTSFVQPCDAGIIRCFKAYYQRALCLRALDMEKAGAEDIYKLNLLEAMLISEESWKLVTKETISNCWKHTKIQQLSPPALIGPPQANEQVPALCDLKAWEILKSFALHVSAMTLPEVGKHI